MQEPIDNDFREFLERKEELELTEKEDLIKRILFLEDLLSQIEALDKRLCANQPDEELPW